jgi:deoxyadenosine/deoxycytidine kinase
MIIVIEGEIGAGKTELAKAIAAELEARGSNVCLVLEPVETWKETGILEQFYKNPRRHAYSFQTFVYATRVDAINRAVAVNPAADVYILERSPATDLIFMELQRDEVSPVEMQMYKVWRDCWRRALPIDLAAARVLYLKTSLGQCMARVAQRSRAGEVCETAAGVTAGYQARLRRAHEAFLLGLHADEFPLMPESPFAREAVTVIEPAIADRNFRDAGAERDGVVAAVLEKLAL